MKNARVLLSGDRGGGGVAMATAAETPFALAAPQNTKRQACGKAIGPHRAGSDEREQVIGPLALCRLPGLRPNATRRARARRRAAIPRGLSSPPRGAFGENGFIRKRRQFANSGTFVLNGQSHDVCLVGWGGGGVAQAATGRTAAPGEKSRLRVDRLLTSISRRGKRGLLSGPLSTGEEKTVHLDKEQTLPPNSSVWR